MNRKAAILFAVTGVLLVMLFALNLALGSVRIPLKDVLAILFSDYGGKASWYHIVIESRVPQAVTAVMAGSALAVSGLLLQTLFKNPLAGPSILGVSDGANLGVALVMIWFSAGSYLTTIVASFVGAAAVLLVIIGFSRRVRDNVMLLIIGIMVGYIASSVISILNYSAAADKVRQFVMWGMGNFGSVSLEKLPWMASFTIFGLALSLLLVKPLNALLLGESYASNLGVSIRRTRLLIFIATGLLTATATAFCGPISFIGLAVPHVARLLLGSSNHKLLLPLTILTGGSLALLCNLLTVIPGGGGALPLNAVTSIMGAPVIIYIIVNRRNIHYFN